MQKQKGKMGHKCAGSWHTWTQADIDAAKIVDPDRYKGVTKVQDKICDTCGKLLGEKREYQ